MPQAAYEHNCGQEVCLLAAIVMPNHTLNVINFYNFEQ